MNMNVKIIGWTVALGLAGLIGSNTACAAPVVNSQNITNWEAATVHQIRLNPSAGSGVSYRIESLPSHGVLEWTDVYSHGYPVTQGVSTAFSTVQYTGSPGTGVVTFTWIVNDGTNDSNVGTCAITVRSNTPPVAKNLSFDPVVEGGETTHAFHHDEYMPWSTTKYPNSYDDPDFSGPYLGTFPNIRQTYRVTAVTLPAHGRMQYTDGSQYRDVTQGESTVVLDWIGAWRYRADVGFAGQDTFTWKVNDGIEDSNIATFTATVRANTKPVAKGLSCQVGANAFRMPLKLAYSDPDPQTFTFTAQSLPAHGFLECKSIASVYHSITQGIAETVLSWAYTPDSGYLGADSFRWTVSDGITNSAIGTCTITIISNTVPVAFDQNETMLTNTVAKMILASFKDPDAGQVRMPVVCVQPVHGSLEATNSFIYGPIFIYTPDPGYAGQDSVIWKLNDGLDDSNEATCHILVREVNDRAGMTVILAVNELLLPEIEGDVNRLKADLENEGYVAKIKAWDTTSLAASDLWGYFKTEYATPDQFLAGAILIGNMPIAHELTGGAACDLCYWNLKTSKLGTTSGLNTRQIWVSRICAQSGSGGELAAGSEVALIRRALQANHDYRTGASRLPYMVHGYDMLNPDYYLSGPPSNALAVWPAWKETVPSTAFREGGELINETDHGSSSSYDGVSTYTIHDILAQVRFALCASCSAGAMGGVVNNQILTRGGGNVLSVGASETTYTGSFMLLGYGNEAIRARLAAGDTWGNSLVFNYFYYGDNLRAIFYGDLSFGVMASPSNAMPTVISFTSDRTSGATPLTVDFAVAASDPDGTIAGYEWFVTGHQLGTAEPEYAWSGTSQTHTYTKAHRYLARVEAIDNYKARAWKDMTITVGPEPGQPLRVTCGRNLTYYTAGADYTDGAANLWLHDQAFGSGTWGYSGGNEGYVAQAVAGTEDDILYQRFRTGSSFTYKVPVANGGYWLNLRFADMQSSAAGQRVMDIDVGGSNLMSGVDVYAQMGGKSACVVPLCVEVTDGELTFTVRNNAASPNDAFLNCFEVIPYAGGNRPPLAQSQSVTTLQNTPQAITLTATDADGDPVTFAVATQPAHGTVSGAAPNVVYTPTNGYVGPDQFTFKANDGKTDGNVAAVAITVGGLLAHWPLDETSGTAAADASGHGYGGTLQSTAAWTTGGKINGALQLSGANDMFLVSPVVPLAPDWTICAWFSAPLPNTATWHTLTRAQNDNHHIITDGSLNLGMYDNAGGGGFRGCGYNLGGLSNGWHHLAAVGSGTTTRFYVDGAFVGASDRKSSTTVYAVGNYQGGSQRFSDKIDDVRIYNYALSATELAALAGGGDSDVDAYGIPNSWKIQYFGSTNGPGTGALEDWDHDGMSNLAEYKAGTIPTNALSRLEITGLRWNGTNGMVVLWSSVTGKFYKIRSTTNLLMGFPEELTNHIPGIPATNVCPVPVDSAQRRYYRVVLE